MIKLFKGWKLKIGWKQFKLTREWPYESVHEGSDREKKSKDF